MTVEELFDLVVPRLEGAPVCTIFDAVRGVQTIIVNRLLLKRSDLVQDSLLLDYDADTDNNVVVLPATFHAADGLPYISGSGKLLPMDKSVDKSISIYTTLGTPSRYEIKGRTLTFYPPALTAGQMVMPAYIRPPAPTELTDELLFYGMFDEVFVEGALTVLKTGLAAVSDRNFVAVITSQVDQVLAAKEMTDEQSLADSINYGR